MNSLDNVILISDRVLIKPLTEEEKTASGLFLPPGYHEKEIVAYGYII
jgi:co-chaperonin GroES (HSP10)